MKKRIIKSCPSQPIGKVIKRYDMVSSNNYHIYHNPNSKWAKRKLSYKDRVKKSPKVKEPGYIQVDTIHRFIKEFIQKNIYEVNEIDRFNINMMEHLIWFNALRPHHSLNNLSPIQFMIKSNLTSHMYGTYTGY